jgi:uncharacterized membrane protein
MFGRILSMKYVYVTGYLLLVTGYALVYAPYGINETDGGFITGLAWQVLCGKTLYQDIIYVRPPMSVWMRVLELQILPENWSVLGERWLFYAKTGLYSWLAAQIFRHPLPSTFHPLPSTLHLLPFFGFVLSVHAYPAAAWHTVDGIFWAVLSVFFAAKSLEAGSRRVVIWAFLSGVALAAAMLCKQSFYLLFILVFLLPLKHARYWCWAGFGVVWLLFLGWLIRHHAVESYFAMTNGAATGGQALQHGILDYFRIRLPLLLPGAVLLAIAGWSRRIGLGFIKKVEIPVYIRFMAWGFWLILLIVSYVQSIWARQETTVPFAQVRFLFWLALGVLGWQIWEQYRMKQPIFDAPNRFLASMLLISWCASVSWGYNLPILFSVPLVYAVIFVSNAFSGRLAGHPILHWFQQQGRWLLLVAVLLTFRYAADFIYRDGRRADMTASMGAIFPKLSGIYSDTATAALYLDLKELSERYGPNFTTLPAFPYSNFLTNTTPPLALDWVVKRETGAFEYRLDQEMAAKNPVIFVEKKYAAALGRGGSEQDKMPDPELYFTRELLTKGKILSETQHFWVVALSVN